MKKAQAKNVDYRIRHLPEAAWRIVRSKAGDKLNDGLRRLVELWADGTIDPLSETSPISRDITAGRAGGHARAASLTPERRAEIAQAASDARWAKRPKITYPESESE